MLALPESTPTADMTAGFTPEAPTHDAPAVAPADADPPEFGPPHPAPPAALRLVEALLFAADRPVPPDRIAALLGTRGEVAAVLAAIAARHEGGAFVLAEVAGGWCFRTAPDLAPALTRVVPQPRRLTRAAMETLAIVAWHQPVTRAEIEALRGATLSQQVLDQLLELALVAPAGRREVPGRPTLWVTTPRFLEQFGLKTLRDLPRREEFFSGELALGGPAAAADGDAPMPPPPAATIATDPAPGMRFRATAAQAAASGHQSAGAASGHDLGGAGSPDADGAASGQPAHRVAA